MHPCLDPRAKVNAKMPERALDEPSRQSHLLPSSGVDRMAISKSQARARAAVAQLRERFPAIFTSANCRPLKIGIHNELVALGFNREMAVVGLRSYCGSSVYLSALREGAARIGLDGQPTGLVNAEEEKFAAAQLAEKVAQQRTGA
jgi:ProP effector